MQLRNSRKNLLSILGAVALSGNAFADQSASIIVPGHRPVDLKAALDSRPYVSGDFQSFSDARTEYGATVPDYIKPEMFAGNDIAPGVSFHVVDRENDGTQTPLVMYVKPEGKSQVYALDSNARKRIVDVSNLTRKDFDALMDRGELIENKELPFAGSELSYHSNPGFFVVNYDLDGNVRDVYSMKVEQALPYDPSNPQRNVGYDNKVKVTRLDLDSRSK